MVTREPIGRAGAKPLFLQVVRHEGCTAPPDTGQSDHTPAPQSPPKETDADGHRSRLLERFAQSGLESLSPHEVLELLLTYVIPRRDTKQTAKALVKKFGSLAAVINALPEELRAVKGIGRRSAELFHLVREVMAYCLKERFEKRTLISHRRDIEEYLRFHFGYRRDEYVAAILLDNANRVLSTEIVAEGTVNQCAVYPRIIMEQALRSGAAAVILAHNHPGGGLNPSEADWQITERLFSVGRLLEIPLLDHVIISAQKVISLRDLQRWPK